MKIGIHFMKKIIILLFLSTMLLAQVESSRMLHSDQLLPKFSFDYATYKSKDSSKTKLDVFLKMPYANIQFLKHKNIYVANYTVTVSLYDEDENLVLEKLWNEKIIARTFQQTSSERSFNISYKTINIEPGKYKLICNAEDDESRKYFSYETKVELPDYNKSLNLSDLIIVSQFVQTNEGKKIIPNIDNLVTSRDTVLMFYYEIYSSKKQYVNIEYNVSKVFKDGEDKVFTKKKRVYVELGKVILYESLKNINFALGDYVLTISLSDSLNQIIRKTKKKIISKIFGFPANIKDLNIAIKQMVYIANPDELDAIEEEEDFDKKMKKFLAFWKARDPSPNTVENETLNEYYRRVEYANKHFKGYSGGWNSDMGMVYITLGPPDQVTRRPYEIDSKPYEIWDYYALNRRFIFIDVTNFGDYRLQNYNLGSWFRYRP
jgi:GWxTD domain-containing protein